MPGSSHFCVAVIHMTQSRLIAFTYFCCALCYYGVLSVCHVRELCQTPVRFKHVLRNKDQTWPILHCVNMGLGLPQNKHTYPIIIHQTLNFGYYGGIITSHVDNRLILHWLPTLQHKDIYQTITVADRSDSLATFTNGCRQQSYGVDLSC